MTERAMSQRAAIAAAIQFRAHDEEPGMIHVYGPKLYGPPEPGEYHCTEAAPFAEGQPGPVVFHGACRAVGWTGGHVCLNCGEGSVSEGDA